MDERVIADFPIAIGDLVAAAIENKIAAAIRTLTARKMNGSAYGKPYLAPINPVLHNATNRNGANFDNFKLRKSPSAELEI